MHKGKNERILGAYAVHNAFKTKLADGGPSMICFDNCVDFIRTFPMLTEAKTNPEDIDTRMEDHIYDETRYAVMHVKGMPAKTQDWGGRREETSLLRRKLDGSRRYLR